MANSKTPATADTAEPEEATGYGYLADAEREAAISDHEAAVAAAKG